MRDKGGNRTLRREYAYLATRSISAHQIYYNCVGRRYSVLAGRNDGTTVAVNGSLLEKYSPRLHLLYRGVMPMRYCKTNCALPTFTLRNGKITITFPPDRRAAIPTNLLTITNYSEM